MGYSRTNRHRRGPSRSGSIDVVRAAAARRPAPMSRVPRPPRATSPNERYAPMVIGQDGVIKVHPDYGPNMN